MNRNRLLLIGFIALALGAFVSLVVYRNLQSRANSKMCIRDRPTIAVEINTNKVAVGKNPYKIFFLPCTNKRKMNGRTR